MRNLLVLTLALSALPLATAGQPKTRPDYEFARDAVARGEILPLAEVLTRFQASHPGQVTEVELGKSAGRLVYAVDLVTPGGRLIKVVMDGATGRVVGLNGSPDSRTSRLGGTADDDDNALDRGDDRDDGDDDKGGGDDHDRGDSGDDDDDSSGEDSDGGGDDD